MPLGRRMIDPSSKKFSSIGLTLFFVGGAMFTVADSALAQGTLATVCSVQPGAGPIPGIA